MPKAILDTAKAKAKRKGKLEKSDQAQGARKQLVATIPGKRIRREPTEWWKSVEKPSYEPRSQKLPMSATRQAARARSASKKAAKENTGGDRDAYDLPSNLEEEFDNQSTITPMVPICK